MRFDHEFSNVATSPKSNTVQLYYVVIFALKYLVKETAKLHLNAIRACRPILVAGHQTSSRLTAAVWCWPKNLTSKQVRIIAWSYREWTTVFHAARHQLLYALTSPMLTMRRIIYDLVIILSWSTLTTRGRVHRRQKLDRRSATSWCTTRTSRASRSSQSPPPPSVPCTTVAASGSTNRQTPQVSHQTIVFLEPTVLV